MSLFSNWNGKVVEDEKIYISPNNRSFRYGDGCFETMKVIDGKVLLSALHFTRLFSSLKTLQFSIPDFFTPAYLQSSIIEVVEINGHANLARVRLVAFAGDGGLYDFENRSVNFIIQSWPGKTETNFLNDKGLTIDIYPHGKKTGDLFSSIKSNNYLGYAMAAMWAKQARLDDCILTNAFNRVADATIANVFIVSDGVIKTPALAEGCVGGVMRQYLLNCFQQNSLPHLETEVSETDLFNASEVFLTNASYGIRWVCQIRDSIYSNSLSSELHQKFIVPLFSSATF